jgi:hypothetical protein
MNIFEKKFKTLLELAPIPGVAPEAPPIDPAAAAVEPTTGAETVQAMDQGATPNNPAINYRKQQTAQQTQLITDWIGQIEQFTEFMNGLQSTSLQAQLNNADCDTLFSDISRSETKKISRIAQDLSGLVESLKHYLLSAEDNTQQ